MTFALARLLPVYSGFIPFADLIAPLGDDLVAYWPLNETGTPAQALDVSGNEYHGTNNNILANQAALHANSPRSYDFNGTDATIVIDGVPWRIEQAYRDEGTMGLWVHPDAWVSGDRLIYWSNAASVPNSFRVAIRVLGTDSLRFARVGNDGVEQKSDVTFSSNGEPFFISWSWSVSGNYIKGYINGVSVGTPVTGVVAAGTQALLSTQSCIGSYTSTAGYSDGRISDVFVASIPLSDANHRRLSQGLPVRLIAAQSLIDTVRDIAGDKLWSLQLADQTGYDDGQTVATWPDQSGNNRDWTATGTPALTNGVGDGRVAVRFVSAESEGYTLPDMSGLSESEVIYVLKTTQEPPSSSNRFSNLGSTSASAIYPWTDQQIYDSFGTNSQKIVGNPVPSLTTLHIYNARSANNLWEAEINKTAFAYATTTNTVAFRAVPTIGNRSLFDAGGWSGDLAFCAILDTVLTTGEREAILDALGAYYGILFPELIIHDTFTDPDGTLLTAHTPAVNTPGNSWQVYPGTVWEIQSNEAELTTLNTHGTLWIDSGEVNCICDVDVVSGNGDGGVCIRVQDEDHLYFVRLLQSTNKLQIYARSPSAFTLAAEGDGPTMTPGDPYHITCYVLNSHIEIKVEDYSLAYTSAGLYTAETQQGLYHFATGLTFDNFEVRTI